MGHITDSVFADCPPADWHEAPQESPEAILGTRAGSYRDDESGSIRMAPLTPASVISWPTRAGSANLVECLPEAQADLLRKGRSSLGRPVEEVDRLLSAHGSSNVFWDPLLKSSRAACLGFVKELLQRNMASLQTSQPLSEVGICFVYTNRRIKNYCGCQTGERANAVPAFDASGVVCFACLVNCGGRSDPLLFGPRHTQLLLRVFNP